MLTQTEIYVSYAWNARDESGEDSHEYIVDKFCEACEARGHKVHRDKTTMGYRDSIEGFMREIGAGKYVFAVVSAKYLCSETCMFEAVKMLAHERFEERVFPVVLSDADIFKAEKALDYKIHWKDKLVAYSNKLDLAGRDSASTEWQFKERIYKEIHEHVGEFITRITRLNVLSPDKHLADNFAHLFAVLEKQIEQDGVANGQRDIDRVTTSHPVNIPMLPEPVFPKLNVKNYAFDHCLRPAQVKSVVAKFPSSLNLIGDRGQGRHRFMEDLEACGISSEVGILRMKLSAFLPDYDAFLREIARQGKVQSGTLDLVDLLRKCAVQQNRPILFILENPDELYANPPGMDKRFDLGFLQILNALKNADFVTLLLSSYGPVKDLTFQGQSSPLWLEVVSLNSLSHDDIYQETARRVPELPADLRTFISEQLEFEPMHTHDLLNSLLETLESRSTSSRDFIGQELKALRQKYGNHGRK